MAKSYSRGKKPRRDTIERVALARFLLENWEVDTATAACVRVRVPILKELFFNLYNIICLYHILKHLITTASLIIKTNNQTLSTGLGFMITAILQNEAV